MAETSFADFITNRRRELELTLGDVASGLGVSPVTVSNWSNGEATPEPDALLALADLLEVPADDLAGMAGVTLKQPEPGVNLMPKTVTPADEDSEPSSEETTGPIAMLRTGDEAGETSPAEPTPEVSADDEQPSDTEAAASEQESSSASTDASPSTDASASTDADEEPGVPVPEDDPIDSELAELIEEASTAESSAPEPTPAVVTTLPGPEEEEEEKPRKPRRRPAVRRRRVREEQPVSALPLTYVEDPKQLTRYRIRWALTLIVLVVMFFILLWASRELLSALSEVKQAVTPGGIGGG